MLNLVFLKFKALVYIGLNVAFLLLSDLVVNKRSLIIDLLQVNLDNVKVLLHLCYFYHVVRKHISVALIRRSQEKLPVTDPTSTPHLTNSLYLREGHIADGIRLGILIGVHAKLVGTFFAGFMPAELAGMLMVTLELLVADNAVLLSREVQRRWLL